MSAGPFYGKYRGTVINNVDPLQIGRIQAMVPDVSGLLPSSWAMPCVPVAGINMGVFTVPPIGAGVWIEFERGDPDYPIWVGGYWGSAAETPALAKAVPPGLAGITLQTTLKNGIVVSDTPGPTGGILIQTTTGAMISVSDVGIIISQRQGRDHQHDRADDRREPRRADGDLSEHAHARPHPPPRRHGAVLARGPGHAAGAVPARDGVGAAGGHAHEPVRDRRLRAHRHVRRRPASPGSS